MPQEQPLFNKILTDENNKILVKTPSDNCLDVMSWNKFNEKDVAANNPNGLASVVTQEIHTINKAGDFVHAWIIDIIQKHLYTPFH